MLFLLWLEEASTQIWGDGKAAAGIQEKTTPFFSWWLWVCCGLYKGTVLHEETVSAAASQAKFNKLNLKLAVQRLHPFSIIERPQFKEYPYELTLEGSHCQKKDNCEHDRKWVYQTSVLYMVNQQQKLFRCHCSLHFKFSVELLLSVGS